MHPSSYMQTQIVVYSVCITAENFHKHAIQVAHPKSNLLTQQPAWKGLPSEQYSSLIMGTLNTTH